jgi:hypothetical protein
MLCGSEEADNATESELVPEAHTSAHALLTA